MGSPVDSYGQTIEVQVKLRQAEVFAIFTGGEQNTIIVDGTKMTDPTISHYHITVDTVFTDVFGVQKYFKRDINFAVLQVTHP